MKSPLVSIIIPVYNTGTAATRLIRSLLADQFTDFEIIAIDDGSTDDSLKFLRGIKHAKLRVLAQRNAGAATARNLGIKNSRGRYLIFLDSDDQISPRFLTALTTAISASDVCLAVTGIRYKRLRQRTTRDVYLNPLPDRQADETWPAYILRLLYTDGRLYSSVNKIYHADVVRQHHLQFDEQLDFAEDTKFVLDYLKHAPGRIQFILKPLYIYNYGTDTSTVSNSSLLKANWQRSYQDLIHWLGPHPTKREQANLKKVHLRWQISQALAVARSAQPFSQKLRLTNPFLLVLAEILKRVRP